MRNLITFIDSLNDLTKYFCKGILFGRCYFSTIFSSIHWHFFLVAFSDCSWFDFLKSINKMQYFDGISDKPQILKDDTFNWSKSILFSSYCASLYWCVMHLLQTMMPKCFCTESEFSILSFEKKALCYHIVNRATESQVLWYFTLSYHFCFLPENALL